MHGMVCRVSSPPAYLNFSSCCVGQWRVRDNRTQYCEVEDARAFGDCVNKNPDARNGSDWWRNDTFIAVCMDVDEEGSSSEDGGQGGDAAEENGAGKSF
jgi:hypothetical protein